MSRFEYFFHIRHKLNLSSVIITRLPRGPNRSRLCLLFKNPIIEKSDYRNIEFAIPKNPIIEISSSRYRKIRFAKYRARDIENSDFAKYRVRDIEIPNWRLTSKQMNQYFLANNFPVCEKYNTVEFQGEL